MKIFRFIATCTVLFAVGCSQFQDTDEKVSISTMHQRYYALLEEKTKTYVENNKYLRWHAEDEISVFPTHTTNIRYQFEGKTGDKSGTFMALEADAVAGTPLNYTYAVYPYNSTNSISEEGILSIMLPATQLYAEKSFSKWANTSVAVSESVVSDKLFFKNACGYLKLRLYGESQEIKSVTLRGNNGEKISGAATITATFEGVPEVTMCEGATTDVVIRCEECVVLGATAEEATEFWFVLPPMTFEKGFTIVVTNVTGETLVKSTANKVVIERNVIQPMQALEIIHIPTKPANNEIWYTNGNTLYETEPWSTSAFGVEIISNKYNAHLSCWVITFADEISQIGEKAFFSCSGIKSVTIPESVTSIGDYAFGGCTSLITISIPNSVKFIGNNSFYNCSSLPSITIGNGVISIGKGAFQSCNALIDITIPDSVTLIEDYAFSGCSNLTNVYINDMSAWCKIEFSAFDSTPLRFAKKLYLDGELVSDLVIPDTITEIKNYAFYRYGSLKSLSIHNGITSIGNNAFYNCSSISSLILPEGIESIGNSAFWGCSGLTKTIIPKSVTALGEQAFKGCTGELIVNCNIPYFSSSQYGPFNGSKFTSIVIGDDVSRINNYTFNGCSTIENIAIGKGVTSIGISAFCGCTGELIVYCDIPSAASSTKGAFYDSNFSKVTLGKEVVSIGDYAFNHCEILTDVIMENRYIWIGDCAFEYCKKLRNVTISTNRNEGYKDDTRIGSDAFHNCISLAKFTIPDCVVYIGEGAFSTCTSLKEIYCEPTIPPIVNDKYVFSGNASGRKIYVPIGSGEAYKVAEYWSEYADCIEEKEF